MFKKVNFKDGSSYEGEILNGKYNGHGVFRFANGNCYDGEWKDNKMHGFGIFSFVAGDYYEGEFQNGKYHGKGKYIYANGSSYDGEWQDGLKHGHGKLYSATGTVTEGIFELGIIVEVIAEYNPKDDSFNSFEIPAIEDSIEEDNNSEKTDTSSEAKDNGDSADAPSPELKKEALSSLDIDSQVDDFAKQNGVPVAQKLIEVATDPDSDGFEDKDEDKEKDYDLDDLVFDDMGDFYVIKAYLGKKRSVVFPGKINNKPVKLGNPKKPLPLLGGESIKELVIEDGAIEIAPDFFRNCSQLLEVTIPQTVSVISGTIFVVKQLSQTTVYCEAKSKPNGWAKNWTVDSDLSLPNNGMIIVWDYKYNKTAEDGYYYFIAEDGNKYGIKGKRATFAKYLCNYVYFDIPKTISYHNRSYTIVSVSAAAFNKDRFILQVNIPSTVENIGSFAFSQCYGLTDVTLSDNITRLGKASFAFCASLKKIHLSNSLRTIGDGCFFQCSCLRSIELPDTLQGIGEKAFSCCYGLLNVELPDRLKGIDQEAFTECTSLREIFIPRSVSLIGMHAFPSGLNVICERESAEIDRDSEMTNFSKYCTEDEDRSGIDFFSAVEDSEILDSGDGLIVGLEWNFDDIEHKEIFGEEQNVEFGVSREEWENRN